MTAHMTAASILMTTEYRIAATTLPSKRATECIRSMATCMATTRRSRCQSEAALAGTLWAWAIRSTSYASQATRSTVRIASLPRVSLQLLLLQAQTQSSRIGVRAQFAVPARQPCAYLQASVRQVTWRSNTPAGGCWRRQEAMERRACRLSIMSCSRRATWMRRSFSRLPSQRTKCKYYQHSPNRYNCGQTSTLRLRLREIEIDR